MDEINMEFLATMVTDVKEVVSYAIINIHCGFYCSLPGNLNFAHRVLSISAFKD